MIFDIIEIPHRYDPYNPVISRHVPRWDHVRSNSRCEQCPRTVGATVELTKPIYHYKTFEICHDVYMERTFLSLEPVGVASVQGLNRNPIPLFMTSVKQQTKGGPNCGLFRHLPTIQYLLDRLSSNRGVGKRISTSRYLLYHLYWYATGNLYSFDKDVDPIIDIYSMEGRWPPEHFLIEMEGLNWEEHSRYIQSHLKVPIMGDELTRSLMSTEKCCIMSTELFPFLHCSYGSRCYHTEVILDKIPWETNLSVEYFDYRAPVEFNEFIIYLEGLSYTDLRLVYDNETKASNVVYCYSKVQNLKPPDYYVLEWFHYHIRTWIGAAFGMRCKRVEVTKAFTDEIFIEVFLTDDTHISFYVDLGIFTLGTNTLTTV